MADNIIESPTTHQQLECIVNRWLVDYYFFLAIDAMKNDNYSEFCGIRDVLERLLYRPMECTDTMPSKIGVLQFLSRINDGEKLDLAFESDDSVTPLESAVEVLTNLSDVCSISKEDLENVCTSIEEMLVVICLKKGEFEKAKEILQKHFPFELVGKKAILMRLANQKVRTHDLLEQSNFKSFKEDMVNFSVQLFPTSEPFLYKAAKQLADKRLVDLGEASDQAGSPARDEAHPADTSQYNAPVHEITGLAPQDQFIQKKRLIAAYTALSKNSNKTTFAMLEEEQHNSTNHSGSGQGVGDAQPRREPLKVDSSRPKDPCVGGKQPTVDATDQFPCTSTKVPALCRRPRRLYSVAQLVQEPDSQVHTQGSTVTGDPTQDGGSTVTGDPTQDGGSTVTGDPTQDGGSTVTGDFTQDWGSEDDSSKVELGSRAEKASHSGSTDEERLATLIPPELQRRVPCASRNPTADCLPVRKRKSKSTDDDEDSMSILDSSGPSPQKSFSNKKDKTKGKILQNAKESKEIWSEEESLFDVSKGQKNDSSGSVSSSSKKPWSDKESNILKEAVAKFGEGNWAKIKYKYKFENRTNVNLKDRWRTMKRLKLV